ncbi:MAG: lipopolysaccharide heptosyltransferase I [Candidatus Nitrohelix vancouverensis]|uniref:Lipopolysaccharide heptosyltransferase 1 n=1 Tax=Candidatus Nitrohelix vancouverensis TaxID=2705534 RepID=A0A7T0C2S0_9BACT|nr:MAG: lipopolysaccharide heptosyltransferase I [Candidatus Nitrohelix vancouverensis]
MSAPKKILILKMSALGDVVHTLPTLETLRANYPDAHIAWVVEERFRSLIDDHPDLDEVIAVNTRRWRKQINKDTFREIRQIVRELREKKFDLVLDFHGLLKSGLFARLSQAKDSWGFHKSNCKEAFSSFLINNHAPPMEADLHVVERNLTLAQAALPCAQTPMRFDLPQSPSGDALIENYFRDHPEMSRRRLAGINPGAGFRSKLWSLEKFAELGDRLSADHNFSILVTWGPGEEGMAQSIAARMQEPCWVAPATTIVESLSIYRRLDLFIASDSGPAHLSAALNRPTVALFGPTNPARNGPYGAQTRCVFKKLPCSFCWKRTCPLGTDECMQSISVEDVLESVHTVLQAPPAPTLAQP